jgi:hypothetical protein
MSDFSGHFKGGIFTAFSVFMIFFIMELLFHCFSPFEFPVFVFLALFGALWPDTDIGSKSRIYIYMIFIITDILLIFLFEYFFEAAILGLFAMLPAISKHRGWTHSILGSLVVGFPLLAPSFYGNSFLVDLKVYEFRSLILFGIPYFAAFMAGALSHLYLDKASVFNKKPLKKGSTTKK